MFAGRPQGMKLVNESLVRAFLLRHGAASSSDIAQQTGLSQTTVGQVLGQMEAQGQILKLGLRESSGGRRAACWALAPESLNTMMLIIEQSRLTWAIGDALGKVLRRGSEPVLGDPAASALSLVASLQQSFPTGGSPRQALAIGVPGAVLDGCVMTGFLAAGWSDLDFRDYFRRGSDLPLVIENDLNAIALGYLQLKVPATAELQSLVYIHFNGLCTGAGLVIDGQVVRGARNFAGELGFLPIGKGANFDESLTAATDDQDYAATIVKALQVVNCVINPGRILVGGTRFRFDLQTAIRNEFAARVEVNIRPDLEFIEDSSEYYLTGLGLLAIEQAFPAVRLVNQRQ